MADQTADPAVDAQAAPDARAQRIADQQVQSCGFLIELSPDWIVLRASENIHRFLGESHVTLIDEPLGKYVPAQSLHDLRNLFSRLSGTTGIARAYRVRLSDEPRRFDVAFHMSNGRVLLEGAPSAEQDFGEAMGAVGGLIDGMGDASGDTLIEAGARRMRALTGYDRVLICYRTASGEEVCQSSRGSSAPPLSPTLLGSLAPMIADTAAQATSIFPRRDADAAVAEALLRAPEPELLDHLRSAGVRSALTTRFAYGRQAGVFHCFSGTARAVNLEMHAAAELFAQMFAMRLEIDQLLHR